MGDDAAEVDPALARSAAFSAEQRATLKAVVERMVPADEVPSGWAVGVGDYIGRVLAADLAWRYQEVMEGLDRLDHEAGEEPGAFAALAAEQQDALLGALERAESVTAWTTDPAAFIELLASMCAQGFYGDPGNGGNRDEVSWRSLGYGELAPGLAWPPPEPAPGPTVAWNDVRERYDCVVIGAGAGGCVAAQVLAEADLAVLLVDRGHALSSSDLPLDHLRSERSSTRFPTRTGADPIGDLRVVVTASGAEDVSPTDSRWSANAFAVGGGTRVYGAQAWRLVPDDLRMASKYGVPEGSSLADWPIAYDDLEPWYDRCEWEYGVSGDAAGGTTFRRRQYPMPPLPETASTPPLRRGAGALGISTGPVPLLINSVPYGGRGACLQCGTCVGFACHAGAKNGGQNTALPRALATGRCDLLTSTQAERIVVDEDGRANGVVLVADSEEGPRRRVVTADRIVVAAGAVESARLLLNSRTTREPHGMGNTHDLVGRNLQSHVYAGAIGFFDEVVQDAHGPGPNIATQDFRHDNPGHIGGGMIANDFVPTPLNVWSQLSHLGVVPKWGAKSKSAVRDVYSRMQMIFGPVQEVPNPESRVTLDPIVTDRFGIPVARLSGDIHPEDRRTARLLAERASDWLAASGARDVIRITADDRPHEPSGGQHQAGTCRMGSAPSNSVTDSRGRIWGHQNVLVADGSVHVTNGGVNPVLTIMALAYRNATSFAREAVLSTFNESA